jgi:hypothetical protein
MTLENLPISSEDLIKKAKESKEGYYEDMLGLAERIAPELKEKYSIKIIADFILGYEQMWHDVQCADPFQKDRRIYTGSLYLDKKHEIKNPLIRPLDYLRMFKEFTNIWAARKQEKSPEECWYKAQDEFAGLIKELVINYG